MVRRKPPRKRRSQSFEFQHESTIIKVSVSFYEDGTPCEIFFKSGKVGTFLKGILEALSLALCSAIQHGATVQDLYDSFNKNAVAQEEISSIIVKALDAILKGEIA